MEALAREEQADFVITSTSDAPVRVAAVVSERLGLPTGISSTDAVCATQKDAMRRRLADHGVPMPEFEVCNSADEFGRALERVGYDCIAKPADSAASRGVKLITPEDRATSATELFDLFRSFSRKNCNGRAASHRSGGECGRHDVDGKTTILTITDKLTTEPPFFVELGHSEPQDFQSRLKKPFAKLRKRPSMPSAS